MNVFRALGVRIDGPRDGRVTVHGVGRATGCAPPSHPLDCGNAGTAMRLLMGLLAGQRFESTLVGDESLSQPADAPRRRAAGARWARASRLRDGRPPVRILPVRVGCTGIDYPMPVASAQVKSALLLAGLYARGETPWSPSRRRRATTPSACWAASASQVAPRWRAR